MKYIRRFLEPRLHHHLSRGKSVLLLGPRQTGKSTLLSQFQADLSLSFIIPAVRQRYEKNLSLLTNEIEFLKKKNSAKKLFILLDEVQKVPRVMDVVQDLIDRRVAQFILTGSSARKLRRGSDVNLLPGRVVTLRLDPFIVEEYARSTLEDILVVGSLPGIVQTDNAEDQETDLRSYVETYLEEEVRAESLVRNIGGFSRFLEFAGLESGKIVSFRALSQEIGVSHTTIASYFEILEDCLIAERVDPITHNKTRKKLTKSSKYLVFDLGVRRLCAGEGRQVSPSQWGELFEQFIGLELIRHARLEEQKIKIRFWRDPDGPEVDWIIEKGKNYIPIEVKWTDKPSLKDVRHLEVFLKEYTEAKTGYLVCRIPRPLQLNNKIIALPWQQVSQLVRD